MKKAGIIGGTGPESTIEYYQAIISHYQERIGSREVLPELFINSINMYKIFELLSEGRTEDLTEYLAEAARKLEGIGADFVIMAANTPHIVFNQVQERIDVPMISIVEATCEIAQELNLKKIGLIGTKFTMENDFFKKPFLRQNIEIIVPSEQEQTYIHQKTIEELENGIVKEETKKEFLSIINGMKEQEGINGIILGCTEFPMLIKEEDLDIQQLNTTEIHINKIVDAIFKGEDTGL